MYSDLAGSKSGEEEEARKLGTYSGAKCSIVERWFPVTGNCFVECIIKQIIKYSWTYALIRELGYANPRLFSPSEKKVNNTTLGTGAILQHRSPGCRCLCHEASEQTELQLLISRPPLRWLVTHKEQNSTQPPILLKNTTVRKFTFPNIPESQLVRISEALLYVPVVFSVKLSFNTYLLCVFSLDFIMNLISKLFIILDSIYLNIRNVVLTHITYFFASFCFVTWSYV
jgi:hypothetical protein